MSRLHRVGLAPPQYDQRYVQSMADAINGLPWLSQTSGSPSGLTAPRGAIAVNYSQTSHTTQRLWINTEGTPSSWSYVSYL
jgi:lysophospholipase L1-like esterase